MANKKLHINTPYGTLLVQVLDGKIDISLQRPKREEVCLMMLGLSPVGLQVTTYAPEDAQILVNKDYPGLSVTYNIKEVKPSEQN